MSYNLRIDENFLRGDHVDGEVLQHTDLNEIENVTKTAINANYEDIQKLQDGTISIGNSEKLDGATLSKFATETLQNSDTKVPTSSQVKQYVDGALSNIDLDGYYTKRETDALLEENYYSKDETIPCFVGTSQTPIEITEAFASVGNDDKLIFIKGDKTLCDDYYPDGELFFFIPDVGGYYNIYDVTDGRMYKIQSSTTTVVGVSDTKLNLLSGSSSNPINLDTIDSGVYIIDGNSDYILGGSTHYGFGGNYAIVGVQSWNNDTRKYVFSDGSVVEITRTESGGDYVYSWSGDYQFVTNEETYNMINGAINSYAEYVDETYAKTTDIPDLTDYVKNTDYATASKAGVIKTSWERGTGMGNTGIILASNFSYNEYNNNANDYTFIGKGTLENVITGKGLVSNTDYATSSTGGTLKIDNGLGTGVSAYGVLVGIGKTYAQYNSAYGDLIISKGTLENVLTNRIGNIQTLLDNLDTGSGV